MKFLELEQIISITSQLNININPWSKLNLVPGIYKYKNKTISNIQSNQFIGILENYPYYLNDADNTELLLMVSIYGLVVYDNITNDLQIYGKFLKTFLPKDNLKDISKKLMNLTEDDYFQFIVQYNVNLLSELDNSEIARIKFADNFNEILLKDGTFIKSNLVPNKEDIYITFYFNIWNMFFSSLLIN